MKPQEHARVPDGGLARARREARNSTIIALGSLALATVLRLSWWNAQVNHFTLPRSGGFIEGDPFPWFLFVPILGVGLWFGIVSIRDWVRYFRARRS